MDRISDLPKNIIECILERLPIQDAVRTSILSRKWRYKWITISELVFDNQFVIDYFYKKSLKVMVKSSFESIINKVLLLHSGSILKFVLCITKEQFRSSPDISLWISLIFRSGIKDFTLDNQHTEFQILPTFFFSSTKLTHLNLYRCKFSPPPSFSGFRHLLTLCLIEVSFTTVKFETMISTCPLLETLTISFCSGFNDLKIDSPTLKFIKVVASVEFDSICFINTQNLTTVSVALYSSLIDSDEDNISNMIKVFDSLPKVEKLWLQDYFIKFLAAGSVPKRLPKSLNYLTRLTLGGLDFMNLNEVSCAFCLIRSSHNLKELEIWGKNFNEVEEQSLNYLEEQDCTGCCLDQLCLVKFTNFAGLRPELEIIKFLLACSPSLETLIIELKKNNADAMLRVSTELLRYPRVSSKGEIICRY